MSRAGELKSQGLGLEDNGLTSTEIDKSRLILSFEDVSFGYDIGSQLVIERASLGVAEGSFVTLFGKSGCGKSTLLNLAAGLFRPTVGAVYFRGKPVRDVNTEVAYMTQDDTLLPWRTVRANVELPLRLRKANRREVKAQVDRYLSLAQLTDAARKYPSELSGGMRRRCLLARSLVYNPEVLLMDEPFGGIDVSLRESLHSMLRSAVEELKLTVLFVTHDVGEAALLSDEVAILGSVGQSQPTRIAEIIRIPFGTPRDLASIRRSTEFGAVQMALRRALDAANGEGVSSPHSEEE